MLKTSFNDFIHKYGLKKTTLNIKPKQILSSWSLSDVGTFLREGSFESDIGLVNLHPTKGTHWVAYINENYFDSYGWGTPNNLFMFIIKRNQFCLYCE